MEKYVCPVCDQVMSSKHYCPHCKRRVKEPYIRKTTYYLNERHPLEESDCTYHVQEGDGNHSQYGSKDAAGELPGYDVLKNMALPAYQSLKKGGTEHGTAGTQKSGRGSLEYAEELVRGLDAQKPMAKKINSFVIVFFFIFFFIVIDFILPRLGDLIDYINRFF